RATPVKMGTMTPVSSRISGRTTRVEAAITQILGSQKKSNPVGDWETSWLSPIDGVRSTGGWRPSEQFPAGAREAKAPGTCCIVVHEHSRRKAAMSRIKQLLAQGEIVRVFGIGQLISPKLIEIVGEHGGFDALWLDGEHAGIGMREIELATLAARAV